MWKEPIPISYYRPGDYIKSPGGMMVYKILTPPFCRLYPGEERLEPHSFESAWVEVDENKHRKIGPNFLSYVVAIVYTKEEGEKYKSIHSDPDFGSLERLENVSEFLGKPFVLTDRCRKNETEDSFVSMCSMCKGELKLCQKA